MSLFTKNRKAARLKKQEQLERLELGFKQIEASMKRTLQICKAIMKDHPEFYSLDLESRIELWKEYYMKYEKN